MRDSEKPAYCRDSAGVTDIDLAIAAALDGLSQRQRMHGHDASHFEGMAAALEAQQPGILERGRRFAQSKCIGDFSLSRH